MQRSRYLLSMILAPALLATGCGDTPGAPDAQPDAAPPHDALVEAGVDGANLSDAGELVHYDAGLPPCEAPGYFSPLASRFAFLHLSDRGDPGDGLDLDGDVTTCSPQGLCGGGVDNQLALLNETDCWTLPMNPWGFNYIMDEILVNGDPPANWLLEARGLSLVGDDSAAPFDLILHQGYWYPSASCDEATDALDPALRCDYISDGETYFWGSCDPVSMLHGAEIINGRLVAGGPSQTLSMVYTAFGLTAGMVLHRVRVEANVTVVDDAMTLNDGILAGVICPSEMAHILSAIASADPEQCSDLPPPDQEIGCSADNPDGISVGFNFNSFPAHIVGLLRN